MYTIDCKERAKLKAQMNRKKKERKNKNRFESGSRYFALSLSCIVRCAGKKYRKTCTHWALSWSGRSSLFNVICFHSTIKLFGCIRHRKSLTCEFYTLLGVRLYTVECEKKEKIQPFRTTKADSWHKTFSLSAFELCCYLHTHECFQHC